LKAVLHALQVRGITNEVLPIHLVGDCVNTALEPACLVFIIDCFSSVQSYFTISLEFRPESFSNTIAAFRPGLPVTETPD